MSPTERYLIWSFEHRAWWGRGRVGYTTATHRAGIYTAEEANEICNEANRNAIEDFMVPAPSQSQIEADMAADRGPSARIAAALKHKND